MLSTREDNLIQRLRALDLNVTDLNGHEWNDAADAAMADAAARIVELEATLEDARTVIQIHELERFDGNAATIVEQIDALLSPEEAALPHAKPSRA